MSTDTAKLKGTAGVIGLGIMGGAMARNLIADGWRVVGFDVDRTIADAAQSDGIEIMESAGAVAQTAHDIITSLPHPDAVLATAQAIADAASKRCVIVETSTLALQDKERVVSILAPKGHIALDCPLSGTGAQAKTRDLVIYASGDPAEIRRLAPFFASFGRRYFDLGAFGNGTRMKFIANLLVAIHNVASAEAMVLGMKAGLDPSQIVEVIGSGAGTSRVFELRAPLMADNCYEPATMRNAIWQKDMKVIGEFAGALGCPTPLFTATEPIYAATLAMGLGAQDTGAVCAVLERMAGLQR